MAKYYLKPDSTEYFYADTLQITITCVNLDSLNEKGLTLYQLIIDKMVNNEFKDTITNVKISPERSGFWTANKNHPFYDTFKKDAEYESAMCSWNNRKARFTDSSGIELVSNIILMYTQSWIYTNSDSIYKIDNSITPLDISSLR